MQRVRVTGAHLGTVFRLPTTLTFYARSVRAGMWCMPQDITLSSRTVPRLYRSRNGGQVFNYQPSTFAAGSSIVSGDVVQLDVNVSSNNFRIVRSSTGGDPALSSAIVGIALANDPSDGSTLGLTNRAPIPVAVGRDGEEFIFPSKATVAQHQSTLIGTNRAIGYDSTLAIFYCNVANSTAGDARVRITDVLDPGSSNGYVVARFLSTAVTVTTVR